MSSFLYGQLELRRATNPSFAASGDNKFVAAVAALIPAEVIALHALFLARWTTTDAAGTTTITNGTLLGGSLLILLVFGPAMYLAGRKNTQWGRADWIRLLIPALAFLAWAALLGTSALTPWVAGRVATDGLWLTGVLLGAILIVVSKRLG